jgi:hypothetical protein
MTVYGRESGDWGDGPPEAEFELRVGDRSVCWVCGGEIDVRVERSVMAADAGRESLVWRHSGVEGFIKDHHHRAEWK